MSWKFICRSANPPKKADLFFGLLHRSACWRQMTGRATMKTGIFSGKGLMTAITGTVRVRSMISHIHAHGFSFGRPRQRVALRIGTCGITVAWQPHMVACAACHAFMGRMIENHIHSFCSAGIQLDGLAKVFKIWPGRCRGTPEQCQRAKHKAK